MGSRGTRKNNKVDKKEKRSELAARKPRKRQEKREKAKAPEHTSTARASAASVTSLYNELACAVCQEPFVSARTIACGHSFCGACIEQWLRVCQSCPMCRHPVVSPPVRSRCLDSAVSITM